MKVRLNKIQNLNGNQCKYLRDGVTCSASHVQGISLAHVFLCVVDDSITHSANQRIGGSARRSARPGYVEDAVTYYGSFSD